MFATDDQNASAALRSSPWWRYRRPRIRVSSTSKNRRNQAQNSLIIAGSLFENRTSPSVFEPSPA